MSVILCPTDCTGLPVVSFDECAPSIHYGEIRKIYFTSVEGDCLTDWDDLAEWTARLLDTGGDENSIRTLIVLGELQAGEATPIRISQSRFITPFRTFTIQFQIEETNAINYDMVRYFMCNLKNKVWFETADGMLYGGLCGVEGSFRLDNIIPRSNQELNIYSGTFVWEAAMLPERTTSPMAT